MKRASLLWVWRWLLAISVTLCGLGARADVSVYVYGSGFSPASVSIAVGDFVYFAAADTNAPYCIHSTTGAWADLLLSSYGDGSGLRFNQKGDYYYLDAIRFNTGVVHVGTTTTNQPSLISITAPTAGASFTEPASLAFAADVSDPDSAVAAVEFYVRTGLVSRVSTAPFSAQVTNLAAGDYTLTVVAYDAASAATAKSVTITVQPRALPGIRLSAPRVVAGQVQFEATGLTTGKQAVLQASASPASSAAWQSLQTNTVTAASVPFSQQLVPGTRVFRVLQLP